MITASALTSTINGVPASRVESPPLPMAALELGPSPATDAIPHSIGHAIPLAYPQAEDLIELPAERCQTGLFWLSYGLRL